MSSNETSFSHQLPITDLIQLAGDEPLKDFVWGQTVCQVLNTYLSASRQVTIETTGREVSKVMKGLHVSAILQITQVSVDLTSGEIHYRRDRRADDPTLSNTHIALPPIPRPTPSDRPAEPKDDGTRNTHARIMLFISGSLVAVMFILTFALKDSHSEGHSGSLESSLLETVVRTLGEVFKSTAENAPRDPGPMPERGGREPVYHRPESPMDNARPSYGPDYN